jgi:steroid delta-isomerase-like uncharacterized protein
MKVFVSLFISLSSLLASGGTMSNQDQLTSDTVRNKETIKKLFEEIINNGKMDSLGEIFSADYRSPTGEKGPEGFANVINPLKKGFPDIHYEIQDLLGEGETVVIHWFWNGTHEGTFREFEPSHKKVRSEGISFFKFKGDKVVNSSILTDRLGFLQEIGVLPKNIAAPPKN